MFSLLHKSGLDFQLHLVLSHPRDVLCLELSRGTYVWLRGNMTVWLWLFDCATFFRRTLDYQEVLDALSKKGISIRVASPKLVMEEVCVWCLTCMYIPSVLLSQCRLPSHTRMSLMWLILVSRSIFPEFSAIITLSLNCYDPVLFRWLCVRVHSLTGSACVYATRMFPCMQVMLLVLARRPLNWDLLQWSRDRTTMFVLMMCCVCDSFFCCQSVFHACSQPVFHEVHRYKRKKAVNSCPL